MKKFGESFDLRMPKLITLVIETEKLNPKSLSSNRV